MRKRNKEWYFEKDHKICTNFNYELDLDFKPKCVKLKNEKTSKRQ